MQTTIDSAGRLVIPKEIRREAKLVAGTVLQEPEAQLVMNSVGAEIALALEHRGAAPGAVARAVEEVALALGVERLLDRRLDTLSGGELHGSCGLRLAGAPRSST